jgi:signal peptidase I
VVELFVFTLLAIMLISTFAFRHSVVEGSSMETTLFGGDHLLVSDLFYEPERGDIIICDDKSKGLFGIDAPIVKRVIALEGDTVRIDIYGQVYINDILLEEDYLDPNMKVAARGEEYVLTVPEGQVFVLGDNRFYSKDSDEFGPIDEDSILGKVILRFYPFDKIKVFN